MPYRNGTFLYYNPFMEPLHGDTRESLCNALNQIFNFRHSMITTTPENLDDYLQEHAPTVLWLGGNIEHYQDHHQFETVDLECDNVHIDVYAEMNYATFLEKTDITRFLSDDAINLLNFEQKLFTPPQTALWDYICTQTGLLIPSTQATGTTHKAFNIDPNRDVYGVPPSRSWQNMVARKLMRTRSPS